MERIGKVIFLVIVLVAAAMKVNAAPTLSLGSASAQPGGTTTLDLSISDNAGTNTATYAGMNARIIFDTDKVYVTGVSKGAGLQAGDFTIDYGTSTVNGHNEVAVIAYSGQNTFTGSSGVLLKLTLQVDIDATEGAHTVQFATSDTNALINAKHALSNDDGSISYSSRRVSCDWNRGICGY